MKQGHPLVIKEDKKSHRHKEMKAGVTLVDTQVQDVFFYISYLSSEVIFGFAFLSISERFRGPFGILGLLPTYLALISIHTQSVVVTEQGIRQTHDITIQSPRERIKNGITAKCLIPVQRVEVIRLS